MEFLKEMTREKTMEEFENITSTNITSTKRFKETKLFLKNWGIISCTAFVLNTLLWLLTTDEDTLQECPYEWDDAVFDFLYCALYVLVSLSVSNLIRRLLLRRRRYCFTQFFLHSGAMLIANVLIAIGFENIVNMIYEGGDEIFWDRIYVFTTIATLLTIIYLCLYYSSIIIRQGKRNVEMQKELLKLQLDPHFVFNSLSTLTELIGEDSDLAEAFTLKFSTIYRYIVNQLNQETVAIANEIKFIHDYCDLLEIRHPHHYIFHIEECLAKDSRLILPMSLQVLVENAVKHNAHSSKQPLKIDIYLSREEAEGTKDEQGKENEIVVRNEKIPLKTQLTSTTKIGLKNLNERYALLGLHPTIIDTEDAFEVRIPIIKSKKIQ